MDNRLLDFVESLKRANSFDSAWSISRDFFVTSGTPIVHMFFGSSLETIRFVTNIPDWWVDHYNDNNYIEMDHIGRHCFTQVAPLLYGLDVDRRNPAVPADFYRVMQETREALALRNGMAFPCPSTLPHYLGGINLGGDFDEGETRKIFTDRANLLQVAAVMAHSRLQMLHQQELRGDLDLTTRQKDIILLLASGLRIAEIAFRLNIKEETVQFHLGAARKSLGCATRDQLVAKAIYLGLLSP